MITYGNPQNDRDLEQIIELQKRNIPENISAQELQREGFVTVHHNLGLLRAMNEPYGHIVARDGERIVGYALTMLRRFEDEIPVLIPMFREINAFSYCGELLGAVDYYIIGQDCVAKGYRGQGVFAGLFDHARRQMQEHFKYAITQVADRNPRSIRAHEKVGFRNIHEYDTATEHWVIMLWDWH